MKLLKQTIITTVLALTCMVGAGTLTMQPALAAQTGVKCTILPDSICKKAGTTTNGHSAIWYFLILILNIFTAGVGVAAVIGIIIAAILYSSAEDKADQVQKSKMMIWNIVLGLTCYLAMYALLQFIIPGGIFS